jgi:hypothetical protein
MQGSGNTQEIAGAKLLPATYFFNAPFAKSNKVTVYPTALRCVVSGLLIDSRIELQIR